jgi:hypothetical protein
VEELRRLLEQGSEYVVPAVDALSNLNLKSDLLVFILSFMNERKETKELKIYWNDILVSILQEKIRETVQQMLNSAKVEDLPVLLKFLFQTVTPQNVLQVSLNTFIFVYSQNAFVFSLNDFVIFLCFDEECDIFSSYSVVVVVVVVVVCSGFAYNSCKFGN